MKKLIKKIVVHLWQWLYLRGVFPGMENKAVIFMLHRMSSPDVIEEGHSAAFLEQALTYLTNKGYNFISVETLFECINNKRNPPKRSIAFTIDDGFEDQIKIAAPIFIENQCPVTVFLITNFIDTGIAPWDSLLKHIFFNTQKNEIQLNIENETCFFDLKNTEKRYESLRTLRNKCKELSELKLNKVLDDMLVKSGMENISFPLPSAKPTTWEAARSLESHGVSFSPHTKNHAILSKVSNDTAKIEIFDSWDRIKEELSHPCPVFAYPTGRKQDFSLREINLVKDLGLTGAVTAEPGYLDFDLMTDADKFLVKRTSFPSNLEDLVQIVSGLELAKHELRKFKFNLKHHGSKYMLSVLLARIMDALGFYEKYENINWDKVTRLVFVCKGNICRSPYAEIKAKRLGFNAVSIGLCTKAGSPVYAEAINIASYRNVKLDDHRARLIGTIEIRETDLVVCMEPSQIRKFNKANSVNCQLTLLGLFAPKKRTIVIDPYGKPSDYFEDCFEQIDSALCNLISNTRIQERSELIQAN